MAHTYGEYISRLREQIEGRNINSEDCRVLPMTRSERDELIRLIKYLESKEGNPTEVWRVLNLELVEYGRFRSQLTKLECIIRDTLNAIESYMKERETRGVQPPPEIKNLYSELQKIVSMINMIDR